MAINFNQNSTFNLKPINKESVRGEVMGLLVNGEEIAYAFQMFRESRESESLLRLCHIPKSSIFQFRHRDLWKHSLIQNCSLCFPVALRQPLNLRKKWM